MLFLVQALLFTFFFFSIATSNNTVHKTDDVDDSLNDDVNGGVSNEHISYFKNDDDIHQRGKYSDRQHDSSCLFQTKERNIKLVSSFHDWNFADKQLLAGK